MSALKFLSKKSWHTGLIKNNEKVWLREQAEAKEKQRVAELQKQLEEERRLEEIQRLEIESGRLDPAEVKRRQRIEWMYEDGPTAHSKAAKEQERRDQEDTLLGKKSASLPSGSREKDPEKARLIDVENKLREDPMLHIAMERRRAAESARGKCQLIPDGNLSREQKSKIAAKLARKAERREIREIRKRRRAERDAEKRTLNERPHGRSGSRSGEHREGSASFGLRIPKGGTDVLVQEQFTRKSREPSLQEEKNGGYRRSVSYGRSAQESERPAAQDMASRREQMVHAAERLRRERLELHEAHAARNARDEYEDEQERLFCAKNTVGTNLTSEFAKRAFQSRSSENVSDRIRQKRTSSDHSFRY